MCLDGHTTSTTGLPVLPDGYFWRIYEETDSINKDYPHEIECPAHKVLAIMAEEVEGAVVVESKHYYRECGSFYLWWYESLPLPGKRGLKRDAKKLFRKFKADRKRRDQRLARRAYETSMLGDYPPKSL